MNRKARLTLILIATGLVGLVVHLNYVQEKGDQLTQTKPSDATFAFRNDRVAARRYIDESINELMLSMQKGHDDKPKSNKSSDEFGAQQMKRPRCSFQRSRIPTDIIRTHNGEDYLKTGWIDPVNTFLLDFQWISRDKFMVLGLNDFTNQRDPDTGLAVEGNGTRIAKVREALFPYFGACVPNCVHIPTYSKQIGDEQIAIYICDGRDDQESDVTKRMRTDLWRYSKPHADFSRRNSSPYSVAIVSAVSSYSGFAKEIVAYYRNVSAAHMYLGVCADESSDVFQQYLGDLGPFIDQGFLSLLPLGKLGHAPDNASYETITTCRLPVYQAALYNSKMYKDGMLFVSDFDELLIPIDTRSLNASMEHVLRQSRLNLNEICYIRMRTDEVSKGTRSKSLAKSFPTRCDCPKLQTREDNSNVAGACGFGYVKSAAIVKHTYFASVHTHSACILPNNKAPFFRPGPVNRIWSSTDHFRVHHFPNFWSTRWGKPCATVQGYYKLVPAEYTTNFQTEQ